jgi:flagellar biosynthesis protein FlhB
LAPAFALPLLPFCFKRFLLAFSSSQAKEKEKKTKKKKTIEKKKNAKKGGNFPSSSHFTLSFLALVSALLFQTLSPGIFFFSSRRFEK